MEKIEISPIDNHCQLSKSGELISIHKANPTRNKLRNKLMMRRHLNSVSPKLSSRGEKLIYDEMELNNAVSSSCRGSDVKSPHVARIQRLTDRIADIPDKLFEKKRNEIRAKVEQKRLELNRQNSEKSTSSTEYSANEDEFVFPNLMEPLSDIAILKNVTERLAEQKLLEEISNNKHEEILSQKKRKNVKKKRKKKCSQRKKNLESQQTNDNHSKESTFNEVSNAMNGLDSSHNNPLDAINPECGTDEICSTLRDSFKCYNREKLDKTLSNTNLNQK